MFYINDNIFLCSQVLTKIVDKYVNVAHHYRFNIGDFYCPVELLNASYEKGANLKVATGE